MKTVREQIKHIPCDLCNTEGHKVLYFVPLDTYGIYDETEWKNTCPECYQNNCLKDSDEGLKFIQADKLPETTISARHAECPSCGVIHNVLPDADARFACFGCRTPLIIESCYL